MTPAELQRLLDMAEARQSRDLARLDAALAEDRRLEAEIASLAATPTRDMAEGLDVPLAQQGLRLAWAQKGIARARARRAELAREIAALRAAATRSVGKHSSLEELLARAGREEVRVRAARDEREAPPRPAGEAG